MPGAEQEVGPAAAGAAGDDDLVGLQAVDQGGVDGGVQLHLDRQLLDLFNQVVEEEAVFGVGEGGKEQGAAEAVAALDQSHPVAA